MIFRKLNKKVSFGNTAVRSLFTTSLLMLLVTYVSTIASTIIAGNIVGEDALCAVNLVSPLYNYATFFAGMIGIGGSLMYFRYLGAYKKDRANEIFSQSIILAITIGAILFIAMTIGKNTFINSLEVSEEIRKEAQAFWTFEKCLIFLAPIDFLLFELLYTDTRRCIIANVVFFTVGIGSSIIFTSLYGTIGTSLGMALGTLLCDLVLCSHFISNKNDFSFKFHFSWSDLIDICKLSLVDASTYLDSGMLITLINRYTINHFSVSTLPITAVMITILDAVVIFDSAGSALAPVAEIYLGEGNNNDEKDTAKYSLLLAIAFGLVVSLALIIVAPNIPKFFGLTDSKQIASTTTALRLFAPSMLFYSISYMLISHYIAIRKIRIAIAFEWTKAYILPSICIFIFGRLFGYNGVWGSFVLAELLTVIIFVLGIKKISKNNNSIWLLEDNNYPTFSRSYIIEEYTFVSARDDIESFLKQHKVKKNTVVKIMMVVEDMTNLIFNHNYGKRIVIQYTVFIKDDGIYLYERDNGEIYDLTNSDMDISDFREYIFSCVIDSCDNKRYLMAIDYNRSVFCFK